MNTATTAAALTLTKTARAAVKKYGAANCLKALAYNLQGYGAAGIANGCDVGPAIKTTRAADAAINAGRELAALNVRRIVTTPAPHCSYAPNRLIVAEMKNTSGYCVNEVRTGEEGRQVQGGPMVPGPWAFAFGNATVIDNNGGTMREIQRERAEGLLVEVNLGDVLITDEGNAYRVERLQEFGRPSAHHIALVPVTLTK